MKNPNGKIHLVLATLGLVIFSAINIGCSTGVRVGYRAYDPYRYDYHVWDGDEVRFYSQWNVETNRNPRRDFKRLKRQEQEAYWRWRHGR